MKRNILRTLELLLLVFVPIVTWGQDALPKSGELKGSSYILQNTQTQTGALIIPAGRTVTVNLNGKTLRGNGTFQIFQVASGGKLSIRGGGTITGGSGENGGAIHCNGSLEITGTASSRIVIERNKATSGGGIYVKVSATENCNISYCDIQDNYATTNGGGLCSGVNTKISYSNILRNRAMTSVPDRKTDNPNLGRGGGFYFVGNATVKPVNELIESTVNDNGCMWYGGGGHLGTNTTLTLNENCEINNNTSIMGGAAGLHVTGTATFNMEGGCISENEALDGVGGGIHSSYTCVLNLNGGKISDNKVWGRGGGININTGGNLVLGGTNITGNYAYKGNVLQSCIVSETGGIYSWSEPTKETDNLANTGYGGGITVDAGSCTMNSGSLSGNYAETGGGGIALVMLNLTGVSYFKMVTVAEFELNDGTVANNTTGGDGAGIYLMKNKAWDSWNNFTDENKNSLGGESDPEVQAILNGIPQIVLNGGEIKDNIAQKNGGGAFQDENTKFIVNGASRLLSNESVKSGGGVYISEGNAEINGGIIDENSAGEDGGALYVKGNVTVTEGKSTELKNNTSGGNGGAIYMAVGNFDFNLNGTATVTGNSSMGGNGGAIYQGGGTFMVGSNGNIVVGGSLANSNHAVSGSGGGIFCAGTFTVNGKAYITYNQAKNGGGVCVEDGDVTLNEQTFISDNAVTELGGGLYVFNVKPTPVDVSCVGGSFLRNTAKFGGGACMNGNIDLTIASTFADNEAKNGGAIYMMNGVDMNFGAGLIRANRAVKNSDEDYHATAKLATYDAPSGLVKSNGNAIYGIGGGIFMDNSTTLSLSDITHFGLYNNSADWGADDIFLNGHTNTSITLPKTTEMELSGFNAPNDLYWVEDYPNGDINYPNPGKTTGPKRYDEALQDGDWTLGVWERDTEHALSGNYACITLGYDLVFVEFIKAGLNENEDASFLFSYLKNDLVNYEDYIKILLTGAKNGANIRRVVALPSGEWRIKESTWGGRYLAPEFYTSSDKTKQLTFPIKINRKTNRSIYIQNKENPAFSNIKEHENRKQNLMRP